MRVANSAILVFCCVVVIVGCATTQNEPAGQTDAVVGSTNEAADPSAAAITLPEVEPQVNPRMAFLGNMVLDLDGGLDRFYVVDCLLDLMKSLQDGRITTQDLEGSSFYFRDSLGTDAGYGHDGTFRCIQVLDLGEVETQEGEKVPSYLALYINSGLNINVEVYWYKTRPLTGQKLNVDFLRFVDVHQYESKGGATQTAVGFARPRWAGRNGEI